MKNVVNEANGTSNVFSFTNYREFLRARYLELKASDPAFSHRSFAKAAGLGSPNYLKLVIDGARELALKSAKAFARGLRLNPSEADYFVSLVDAACITRMRAKANAAGVIA